MVAHYTRPNVSSDANQSPQSEARCHRCMPCETRRGEGEGSGRGGVLLGGGDEQELSWSHPRTVAVVAAAMVVAQGRAYFRAIVARCYHSLTFLRREHDKRSLTAALDESQDGSPRSGQEAYV